MSSKDSIEMLSAGLVPEKYLRNIGTIGIDGQLRLLKARVAVIGAGGLGGNVIELLARQGVGHIRVIDGDVFAPHNLNRQLLATESNLGVNKALAAADRIAEVNSDVHVEAVSKMLDAENALELLAEVDVVIDALDNISCRLLVSKTARQLGIPLVHGAIAGFTGQVTTLLPQDAGLESIYKVTAGSDKGIETALGNPAATPAFAAAIQVQEVIKVLTGVGEILRQRLLYFDTELNIFELLDIR
ncbi:HesA/MoeB/ThiF family protein [Dendrosporobacter sp. 1207_IL3150]|uniref:HesA/MoeB/ThiF family protein n=1 Tax=Dendrosporobacter sp. 1207_IL3150 TaxID=3084054 RepID=UPI002FDA4CE6